MTQFLDYDTTNPFSLLDSANIRQVADAMRYYYETQDRDPYLLALTEYAEEEAARQEALDDPPEATLNKKFAAALGVHPSDGATTSDEYWRKGETNG